MDRLGIATSLLSVSSPGVHSATVDLARAVNEAGRQAVVDHPGRFGLLASLPLPDVDAAIAEIAHCCDHLDVDGFVLLTNVGGTYVERRVVRSRSSVSSTVGAHACSLHPTSPACWEHTSFGRPRPMLEFLFDTTRAVVDLVLERHHRRPPRPRADRPARRRGAAAGRRPRAARSRALLASGRRRARRPRPAPLRPRRPRRCRGSSTRC